MPAPFSYASPLLATLKTLGREGLDVLFPPRCASCQRPGHVLCPHCQARLQAQALPTYPPCPLCTQRGGPNACLLYPPRGHMHDIYAFGPYADPLRACIKTLKYDGETRLAERLGTLLAQTYQRFQLEADVLLPVPLHPARQRLRGFNQALLLARVCSRLTGVPVNEELIRQRATQAQVSLTGRSRQQNVMGAFLYVSTAATPGVANRKILIIDDVCTTGATLDACARPLFAAGARSVTGLVLASAWHRT